MTETQTNRASAFPPPLPPPPPPLWAPHLRVPLQRLLTRLDRRKARILRAQGVNLADWHWKNQYAEWWHDIGWQTGAPTADEAYTQLLAQRKAAKR